MENSLSPEVLTTEAVDPNDLSNGDFIRLNEVMQDMWASEDGLWELVQCQDCGKMISKEEVFWRLPKEITQRTVADIMRILDMKSIDCPICQGETRYIYGPENVKKIRRRLLGSVDAFLVLCKSNKEGIVGFEEAYLDSLDRIFELDFTDHYGAVGLPEIRNRVQRVLGHVPNHMFLFSSLGLLEPYRNFQNLFELMSKFSLALPEEYSAIPGLTEMNRGGVTHRIFSGINHGTTLGIEDTPELRAKMKNVGEKYDCDLLVCPDPIKVYKDNFTHGMKNFIRNVVRRPKASVQAESRGMPELSPA